MKPRAQTYTRVAELRRNIEVLREKIKSESQEVRTLVWALEKGRTEADIMERLINLRKQVKQLRQLGDGGQNLVLAITAVQQESATLLGVLG